LTNCIYCNKKCLLSACKSCNVAYAYFKDKIGYITFAPEEFVYKDYFFYLKLDINNNCSELIKINVNGYESNCHYRSVAVSIDYIIDIDPKTVNNTINRLIKLIPLS